MAVTYDNDAKTVTFNVAGSSTKAQNVSATVDVTAYGISVYSNSFNPCDDGTFVAQLCPSKFFPFLFLLALSIPSSLSSSKGRS